METDLASFLSPAGSLVGEVTQRVLEFLSVQDLIEYVASSASSLVGDDGGDGVSSSDAAEEEEEEGAGSPEIPRRQRQRSASDAKGTGGVARATAAAGAAVSRGDESTTSRGLSPEDELPHRLERRSTTGAGDEAGGGSRPPTPYCDGGGVQQQRRRRCGDEREYREEGGSSGGSEGERGEDPSSRSQGGGGRGVRVVIRRHEDVDLLGGVAAGAKQSGRGRGRKKKEKEGQRQQGPSILGVLIGLGLRPWAALGALRGGVAHLLGGVPLLALLRWAAGGASAVLGLSVRVALLPYDVTKGVVGYVVGSLEAMLNVATEIWCELRHLSLAELAVVISCVVSGNALPDFLLNPLDYAGPDSGGSSCGGGAGLGRSSRLFSRSSRETGSLESDGGFLYEYARGGPGSGYSDADSRSGGGGGGAAAAAASRGAWQQAHAMRRRLDRVNRTASLVSYEERAESAVPRAKAQRVRRRMHYAMSLQGFQATVTVDGRYSGADDDEDGSEGGAGTTSAGGGDSSSFMCTPQSFPPTPVSRAHVMARTSQFSDDILFLARDQLRLGENLKPGVDETTRATADFLRRQQRLAVLDGNDACEGIVLTCGHHRATKVGPSLYSSARAMVPVLRNRHVYFQVSCMREGPLAPSIGVGLSTPEMPLSTLVGAFSNSVGLCSTGQVLMSSRWYGEPGEFAMHRTGMSTVGVLVYLDGSRPFRSWDGDMVRALVSFSVDGRLVRVATGPGPQAPPVVMGASAAGQQPLAYGPPPPAVRPAPTVAMPQQANAATAAMSAGGAAQQQQRQRQGGGGLLSPSSWSPPVEETAPWEVAAASAAAAAAAASAAAAAPAVANGAHLAGEGGVAGTTGQPAPGLGARGAVTSAGRGGAAVVAPPTAARETSAALGLALPKDRDLFPTVTIHSANTEVMCRFCAEDLVWVTREGIGAPPGVAVYALDGSLIDLPQ